MSKDTTFDRAFLRNLLAAITSNAAGVALAAVTTIIVVRKLPIADWTIAAVAVSLGPLIATALSMGSVTYHVREISKAGPSPGARLYRSFLSDRLLWTAIIATIGMASGALLSSPIISITGALASLRFLRAGAVVSITAARRFSAVAAINILEKFTSLSLILVAVFLERITYASLPLAQAAGCALSATAAMFVTHKRHRRITSWAPRTSWSLFRMWRGSKHFGITSLSGSLQQADITIVTAAAGAVAGGYFAAAARVPGALSVLGSALALVVVPSFSRPGGSFSRGLRSRLILLYGTLVAGTSILAITADYWIPPLLGAEYLPATLTVQVYLAAVCVNAIFQPTIALLQSTGSDRTAGRIVLAQVLATLTLQYIAAYYWGAVGAAVVYLSVLSISTSIAIRVILGLKQSGASSAFAGNK